MWVVGGTSATHGPFPATQQRSETCRESNEVPNVEPSRQKVLQRASGFFLTKSKLHRSAQEAVEKSLRYAFVGRRRKKRDFRSLWIVRISAAAKSLDCPTASS